MAQPAWATQDDVVLPVPAPERLFSGNPEQGVRWLSAATGKLAIAPYLVGGDFHRYHGKAAGELALVAFGPNVVFAVDLSMETVADHRNEINFRLVRLYYQFFPRVEWQVGPGVLVIGARHRCSHGADSAVEARILINTPLKVSYSLTTQWDKVELTAAGDLNWVLVGQNTDRSFQPRGQATLAGQLGWQFTDWLQLSGGAGVGLALTGEGAPWVYSVAHGTGRLSAHFLPAAYVGLIWRGHRVTARTLVHYQRILDSGFTLNALPTHLVSGRVEFVW